MGVTPDPIVSEARGLFSRDADAAIRLLRGTLDDAAPGARRDQVADELCAGLLRAGRLAEARDVALAELALDPVAGATRPLRVHLAAAHLHLGAAAEALRVAMAMEDDLGVAGDPRLRVAAIAIQGDALSTLGRVDEACAVNRRGIDIASGPALEQSRAQLLGQLGRTLRRAADPAGAMHAHLQAVRLHRQAGRVAEVALELGNVAIACSEIGAADDAASYSAEARAAALECGEPRLRWTIERTHSHALQAAGRLAESVDHARIALEIATDAGSDVLLASSSERLGAALCACGEFAGARPHLERAVELAATHGDDWVQLAAQLALAEVLVAAGELDAARDACRTAEALAARVADGVLDAELQRVSALVHERRGDAARALDHVRRHHELLLRSAVRASDARMAELRMQHEAEQGERQLLAAFESLPDGVLLVRSPGTIAHANSAAARMFGVEAAALRGSDLRALLPAESRDRAAELARGFFDDLRPRTITRTLHATRADGVEFPVEIALGVVRTHDETLALCSVRDVSKLRRAEAELRAALSEVDELRRRLEKENVILREELESHHGFEEIVGSSPPVRAVLRQVEQVAPTEATVLLLGETGTGKELFARAIHARSARQAEPLVTVNCAALPESLIESELFGHVAGSFTGALGDRVGRFEMADGGTIFLDEIGDLPLAMQAKLLRVLQDGEMQRIGAGATRRVDVRVLAATNHELFEMVSEGTFRADLYYRLNVFPIRLPPLRDRVTDIPLLVWFFVQQSSRRLGRRIDSVPEETMDRLRRYAWPGNVREMQNVVERAVILASDGVLRWDESPAAAAPATPGDASRLEDVERAHITGVLERCGWRVKGAGGAAELLGLNASTLRSRMRKLGIERPPR